VDYFPLFANLRDQPCLIVGGGRLAVRKAEVIARAGARIEVVAPDIDERLAALAATTHLRKFAPKDVEANVLVIAATSDRSVNKTVSDAAKARHIPVNVVDDAELSTVIFPSIVDRSPLVIAISTGGASPVLLRQLRTRLEALMPAAYGRLAEFAGRFRKRVADAVTDGDARRRFWERLLEGPVGEAVLTGREQAAERMLEDALGDEHHRIAQGEVYLVGAGPGDPDLLTLRALRLMQQADIVLYDNLVSDEIMQRVRRDAEKVYVGKRRDYPGVRQDAINELMIKHAGEGKRVLRLKGGDPFIFGRGGEEIATLGKHGIPFQVVPGITAASGCAAYAGIPLTHRDCAQSVRFVTGHLQDDTVNLDWPELARPDQTLVIYMGLAGLRPICEQLIAHGAAANTPAALIEKGTLPDQRVVLGTLADLADRVLQEDIRGPTITIVGEVVKLHDALKWRDTVRPL
jgi:uroporphyrin-III C-methyltransferase/precorrin-2 dehydrogenase/sirohydrochlorin ferrochelatase